MDPITMLVFLAISVGVSYLLRPKQKVNNAKPATESDFDFPTAEEGRPIPVLFGTRRITAPNVVWYGDISSTPIRK